MENLVALSLVGLVFLTYGLISLPQLVSSFVRRRSLVSQKGGDGATMSSHLVPRLLRHVRSKAELYIVEHHASALTARSARRLRRFLKMALQNGSTIHYVLTDPHPGDEQKLAQTKRDLEQNTSGTIEFCFITTRQAKGKDDKKLVKSFATFHPVLVENGNQRMMWIEGYHPPLNETLVYAWEFVPPADAAKDPRWDEYKDAIVGLIKKYGAGQKEAYA